MRQRLVPIVTLNLALAVLTVFGLAPRGAARAGEDHRGTPNATANLEANQEVVRRFYEAVNAGNLAAFDTLLAADAVDHNPSTPNQPPGPAGFKQAIGELLAGFPDFMVTNEAFIAQGDKVAVHSTARGTQTGTFVGIPATGKAVEFAAIDIWRIEAGQLAEVWHVEDLLGLLVQLGVAPAPGGANAGTPGTGGIPAATTPSAAASPAADPAANAALARRFYQAVNARNLAAFDDLLAVHLVDHNPVPGQAPGRDGLRQAVGGLLSAFPDWQVTNEDVVAAGDLVVVRSTVRGTHEGSFFGIPLTGKPFEINVIEIWRVEGDRLVETWRAVELLSLLIQVGAIPAPGGGAAMPGA